MKYLFVHIAKTAGTSVNSVFQNAFGVPHCLVHVESEAAWTEQAPRKSLVSDKVFISGHRTFADFSKKLDLCEFFVFTFLRDPFAHVISHLAWIRRLREPDHADDFWAHPPYIQELAEKLYSVDFNCSEDVKRLVDSLKPVEFALLDNPQVRYLRDRDSGAVTEGDVDSAIRNIQGMNDYGFLESFEDDLRRICLAAGIGAPSTSPRKNVRKVTESPLTVSNDVLIDAIYPLIRHDVMLYRQAKNSRNSQKVVGVVDGIHNGKLFGWARFGFNKEPVLLDVFLNGAFFTSTWANNSRSDLREKFGLDCAFECELFELSERDIISVRERTTGSDLKNSPLIMNG